MLMLVNESLKYNNILSVFHAVADEGCETRAEIAASTGLSIVTAGKAVEAFLDTGIFIQRTKQTKTVGRNAGRIYLNTARHFTVIDLSKRNFVVSYYDLSLNCVHTCEHEYIFDYSYTENLCMFLHRVKSFMLGSKGIKYNSICAIVPGYYEQSNDSVSNSGEKEIERIKIREFAKTMAGMPIDLVIDHKTASIKYCISCCKQDATILYVNTDYGIDSRLIIKGRMLKRNLPHKSIPVSENGIIDDLCKLIMFMYNIAGVSIIIIESEELLNTGNATELIKKQLEIIYPGNDIPGINICTSIKYSSCGAALYSRNYWIDRVIR